MKFELYSDFDPSTDQQKVIDKLSKGVSDKQASQLLLDSKISQELKAPIIFFFSTSLATISLRLISVLSIR